MNPARSAIRQSSRGLVFGDRGRGPAIILVHGWCLDRTIWMYLEASLTADGYRVVTPALAGYGSSSHLTAPSSLAEHSEDLADLIEELDLNDGTVICGFAFGAAAALSMTRWQHVAGVMSIGVPSAAAADYTKMQRAMMRDWPLFAQRSASAIVSQTHSDATLSWLSRVFEATPLVSALAGASILADFEPAQAEFTCKVPTVFVHGADDRIVPPSVSSACAKRRGGTYVEIANSGHFVVLDQRLELHRELVKFATAALAG